jgi:hypothetical protein
MNVRLTTIVVLRSTFIPRDNKRCNNSDDKGYKAEGRCYSNQGQNRLQKGDQRKVLLNSPKVATMDINKYSDAHDQNYEDQAYYDTDEHLEAKRHDEQFDEPDISNVQTGTTKCMVYEMEDDHETWECPLVENVNRTEILQRRIQQARVMYNAKIKAKYLQTKTDQNGQGNPPPLAKLQSLLSKQI